ncbi:glycosyltransferase family 2 protein [Niallia circulans]|uniref:glycosyltransferase family 2 protein n=1 Tax=Niallia circulans TaxID=1397 RepID=UPI00148FF2AC|nr:glycosyltransferase family 2 protein [Niallia circulans]QJX64157.1 glycosyltransferase family 2 protein [Niallia circulans]
MKKISIILPVYNGEKYLKQLIHEIRNQKTKHEIEIIAAVSQSTDNSLELSKLLCDVTFEVENFNHAITRHEAAKMSSGEILVFITQDIKPYNKMWLETLVEPLITENNIVATYARQVAYPKSSETERLSREFNYPVYNRLCNRDTKAKWGRKNIYYSDACSATKRDVFFKLGGYNFYTVTNEDVVYALKVINNGFDILYNSNSIVYHSHDFKIKSVYNRYKLIGTFESNYKEELREYSSLGEGKKLLLYLVKNLLRRGKIHELFLLGIEMPIKYFAYKKGFNKLK